MKIVVCIKQVPAATKVEVDPKTGILKRDGIEGKVNPYDLYALETALRIKTMFARSTVTVLTMGPPQCEEMIREAYMMGADDGVILSDRAFAGSDVLATGWTLAQGILETGPFDLIICGRQSTDGDTAQVAAELAEFLDIPHLCNVMAITALDEHSLTVETDLPLHRQRVMVRLPALLAVEKGIYEPRLPSFLKKKATADRPIRRLKLDDLPDPDPGHYGLDGSATRVSRIFPPEINRLRVVWDGPEEETAEKAFELLLNGKFLQQSR